MPLSDSQIVGLVENSVTLLRDISARLNAEPMANGMFEQKTIEHVIGLLKRKIPNSGARKIQGLTYKAESTVSSSISDSQIEAHVNIVIGNLEQIIKRLNVSPMADHSFQLEIIKRACDALHVKKLADAPSVVIDELTVDCQLKTNFPNPPVVYF